MKLRGEEVSEFAGMRSRVELFAPGGKIKVRATANGKTIEFMAIVRMDTPQEAQYYANGGILQYVLRQLLAGKTTPHGVRGGWGGRSERVRGGCRLPAGPRPENCASPFPVRSDV